MAKKSNPIYFFGIILVIVAIIVHTATDTQVKKDYTTEVEEFRAQKEKFFRTDKASPIEDKKSFQGLNYFPSTPEFRIQANLELINSNEMVTIRMSDGKQEKFEKYAYATFQLGGKTNRMLLLKHTSDDGLFLPFSDKTNGFETYGGGRYLDLEMDSDNPNQLMIDFNFAYNPFCAYNKNYSCPLPPRENNLDIEIRAGEKEYTHPSKK